jgi:hypothetical protein
MTKQRRTEIFNVPLAKYILKTCKDELKDYDINALTKLIGKRNSWTLHPIYRQGGEDLDGRNVCEKGLCVFSRKVRNTLARQFYKDVDMVNACYIYFYDLLQKNPDLKKQGKWIKTYYENREEKLNKIIESKKTDRSGAKTFYLSKAFNGKDETINELIIREIEKCEKAQVYYKRLLKEEVENPLGKIASYFYHRWEWATISKIMDFMEKNHINTFCDLHDGFYVDRKIDDEKINEVLEKVKEKFGVEMKIKEMTDFLDIPMNYIVDFKKALGLDEQERYEYLKNKFEDYYGIHKVIQQSGNFLILNEDGTYYLKSQTDLTQSFLDWAEAGGDEFSIHTKHESRFIYNYIADHTKRIVEKIDFYPNLLTAPSNIYNLFNGFYIEAFEDATINSNDEYDFEILKEHFYFITDDFSEVANDCAEYLLDWVAQIFQQPHIKSNTLIILKGGEGVGKSILAQIIEKMLGSKYYYSTASPASDLFGNYNSIGKSKLLINMEEGASNQTEKFYEELKNAITAPTMTIKEKYERSMVLNDYCRYIMPTNNEGIIKISDTNRRFVGFECRHPRKDPSKLVKAMKNDKALYLLYRFLIERNIEGKMWDKFPKTSYYKRCLDNSIPFVWCFVNEIIGNMNTEFKKNRVGDYIDAAELYSHFENYSRDNKQLVSKKKDFENELVATYLFTKIRTKKGNIISFNKETVKDKLKEMGLYEEQLFLD